jgi:hypothetical protein
MPRSAKKSAELIQIVILTLFITSGFLAIASFVFYLMVPSQEAKAEEQENDLDTLVKQFRSAEFKSARQNFEHLLRQAGEAGEGKFRELLSDNLLDLEDNIDSFPAMQERRIGKTTAYTQPLKLREVELQSLFNYLARVRQSHRGVHAGNINLNRKRGRSRNAPADAGDWNADLIFYLHQNEEVLKKYARGKTPAKAQAKPEPAEATPAEPVQGETTPAAERQAEKEKATASQPAATASKPKKKTTQPSQRPKREPPKPPPISSTPAKE